MNWLKAFRGKLTHFAPSADLRLTRWLFLRGVALAFAIAFVSLAMQVKGLIGSGGILPAEQTLAAVKGALGGGAWRQFPSLCLWLGGSDAMLLAMCWGGAALAALMAVGVAPRLMLAAMVALYLSLSVVGREFLSFQWDTLLLETGFVAFLAAPGAMWAPGLGRQPASWAGMLLVRLLLFKLMLMSGLVKLWPGPDNVWRDFTALTYHYYTQPLPPWMAFWAHHWPVWFHKLSCGIMFAAELVAPLMLFGPRRARLAGVGAMAALMLLIAATGNYGFFNWLGLILCIGAMDDKALRTLTRWGAAAAQWLAWGRIPERVKATNPEDESLSQSSGDESGEPPVAKNSWGAVRKNMQRTGAAVFAAVAVAYVLLSASLMAGRFTSTAAYVPKVMNDMLEAVAPFRVVNGYGLFAHMTTKRPELIIEGSHDGQEWTPYEFRWKPGDVTRAPAFVAPHMPRLDWQMWFAALNPRGQASWLGPFLERLLEGAPDVTALMGENPFRKQPPRYVRVVMYEYTVPRWEEWAWDGVWWKRKRIGVIVEPMSLSKN